MTMKEEISAELGVLLADLGEDAERFGQICMDLLTVLIVGALIAVSCSSPADAGLQGRTMFGVSAQTSATATGALTDSHAPASCGLTNDLITDPHRSCIETLVLAPTAS